jgi:hypothetical protein
MKMNSTFVMAAYVMAASIAISLPLSMMSLSWDLYNPDELDLVRSSIDRSLGVPSTAMAWPAGSIQIISQLVIAVLYLTGSHGLSLNSFVEFLARLHQNPSELLMPLRVTFALLNCLSPVFAFLTARRLGCATPIALLCAVGWALSPITMTYHFAVTSDGLAWTLAQASLYAALLGGGGAFMAGALIGVAAGTKITTASLVVTIFLVHLSRSPHPVRSAVHLFAGALVGFLICCPQIWFDPVRLTKAMVGTATGAGTEQRGLIPALNGMIRWIFLLAVVLFGVVASYKIERRSIALVLVVGALVALLPVFAGNFMYMRYIVPAAIPISLLAALAVDSLAEAAKLRRFRQAIYVFCAAPIIAAAAIGLREQIQLRSGFAMENIVNRLNGCRAGTTLLLPVSLFADTPRQLPIATSSWKSMADRAAELAGASDIALQYLQSRGISSSSAKVLWSALTEREQAMRARLVAIESVSDPAACPALFYSPSANSKQATLATNRSALVSLTDQEALSLFAAQPKGYTLLTDFVPDDGTIPFPPSAAWGSGETQFCLFASDPASPGNGRPYRDRSD